jgi:hypothetical protein
MLSQLVYVSKRSPQCNKKDIDSILEASVQNNQREGITGVLLYSKEKFLQCIEGEFRKLSALYDKIRKDKRHYDATMIALNPVQKRSFPSWQMAGKSVDLDRVDFKNQMSYQEQKEFEDVLSGKVTHSQKVSMLIQRFFN